MSTNLLIDLGDALLQLRRVCERYDIELSHVAIGSAGLNRIKREALDHGTSMIPVDPDSIAPVSLATVPLYTFGNAE